MLSSLFAPLAQPAKLGPLGLVEVMDWARAALDWVDRNAFFAKFQGTEAVQTSTSRSWPPSTRI